MSEPELRRPIGQRRPQRQIVKNALLFDICFQKSGWLEFKERRGSPYTSGSESQEQSLARILSYR